MYVFKKPGGALIEAPAGFNPDNPRLELLEDVEEVLVISKVLVKQVRLVARPREERDAVRAEMGAVDREAQKRKTGRKG